MTIAVCIAHAEWLPRRKETLERLLHQLGEPALLAVSTVPEHASTWAARLYEMGLSSGADHVCFLNDDVMLCPKFVETLSAMHNARCNDVLSLHTTFPMARELLNAEQRWFRSFWLTGPAYSMSMGNLQRLVAYRNKLPRWFLQSRNEDNIAMQWMYQEQRPAWHPLPAVVKHDVTVPSSLGYDNHPLRSPPVTWEHVGADLTVPAFWMPRGVPIAFECPWMSSQALASHQQSVRVM